tara:strand:- start:32858 stop:33331 length:474 start_codon:yes stop_codon:yes gene_type:complete
MPIFPGPVSHNNANAPILDATGNQIKGFGFFDDTTARDNLSTNLQVIGFLAIVGTSSPTAFIYNGGGWTNAANWSSVGSGLENVVEDTTPQLGGNLDVNGQSLVSTSNGDIVFTPNGTGKINLDGTVQFKRFSTPPTAFDGGMYADDNDKLYFGVSS